jgi:RNA polymerase sigma-70 factor (ECF subfamily)
MTWMTAIVRNRALDWLRQSREVELGEKQEERLAALPDEGPGPEQLLQHSADAARLAICLKQLPEEQQSSIALAFFHGLSHQELSRELQRPLGTVKTWIRRGLERLRGCLDTA